jgi:hypothetical protein
VWLRDYVHEEAVALKIRDGRLCTMPGMEDTGLEYREDVGVAIPVWRPERRRALTEEADDESYDW